MMMMMRRRNRGQQQSFIKQTNPKTKKLLEPFLGLKLETMTERQLCSKYESNCTIQNPSLSWCDLLGLKKSDLFDICSNTADMQQRTLIRVTLYASLSFSLVAFLTFTLNMPPRHLHAFVFRSITSGL